MENYRIVFTAMVIGVVLISIFSCNREIEEPIPLEEITQEEMEKLGPPDLLLPVSMVGNRGKVPIDSVGRGERIQWRNNTGYTLYFQFMDDKLIVPPGQETGIYTFRLRSGQSSRQFKIGPQVESGEHYYAIFIYERRIFAESESPPKIIIRD